MNYCIAADGNLARHPCAWAASVIWGENHGDELESGPENDEAADLLLQARVPAEDPGVHPVKIPVGGLRSLSLGGALFFTVDELRIDEGFSVGSSLLIDIPAKPGTYIFYCKPHSEGESPDPDRSDMAGRLTVT